MMDRDFWKSAGLHLLERNADGWLKVTPQFMYAYYTRPEVHPIETSCAAEIRLHEALLADPFRPVGNDEIAALADEEAAASYALLLAYRDLLVNAGTIEAAYLRLMRESNHVIPPVFIDQMVHVILRNVLDGCDDPMSLRAAEVFFREQSVSVDNGVLLLADEEIVEMRAHAGAEIGLVQLLVEAGATPKSGEIAVLDEGNKESYWSRSDRFDMALDFRFDRPAAKAFAGVIERWLSHFLQFDTQIEPCRQIEDPDWRWHIGLDREATRILNALYQGETVTDEDMAQIIGLFCLRVGTDHLLLDRVKGRPIYLGLAMDVAKRVKMKPQNLLTNMPLIASA